MSDVDDKGQQLTDCLFPAEWDHHDFCIILFPHNRDTFSRLERAQSQIIDLAVSVASAGQEPVLLLCHSQQILNLARNLIKKRKNPQPRQDRCPILLRICQSNDTWARDTAPTFLKSSPEQTNTKKRIVALDWDFNAYGGPVEGCYWPCDLDRQIGSLVCEILNQPSVWEESKVDLIPNVQHLSVPIVLEGGSIHTDGAGIVMTTEECLLKPNRNPNVTKQELTDILCQYTQSKHIIWLPTGLAFDEDTNGHIDNFACFVRPGHVVLAWTDDQLHDPENYERCRRAEDVLNQEQMTIHKLYLPSPPLYYANNEATATIANSPQTNEEVENDSIKSMAVTRQAGQRLAASYVNFYIANQAILVPQFGVEPWDAAALQTLAPLFPDRTVLGVSSREILLGGGNIHCVTQQVPSSCQ